MFTTFDFEGLAMQTEEDTDHDPPPSDLDDISGADKADSGCLDSSDDSDSPPTLYETIPVQSLPVAGLIIFNMVVSVPDCLYSY